MAAGAQLPSRHAAFPFVALALCDPGPGPSHFNYTSTRYTSSSPELSPQRSANRGKARVQPPPKAQQRSWESSGRGLKPTEAVYDGAAGKQGGNHPKVSREQMSHPLTYIAVNAHA